MKGGTLHRLSEAFSLAGIKDTLAALLWGALLGIQSNISFFTAPPSSLEAKSALEIQNYSLIKWPVEQVLSNLTKHSNWNLESDDEGEDDGGSHPAKFVHIVDSSNFQHQVSSTGHSSKKWLYCYGRQSLQVLEIFFHLAEKRINHIPDHFDESRTAQQVIMSVCRSQIPNIRAKMTYPTIDHFPTHSLWQILMWNAL